MSSIKTALERFQSYCVSKGIPEKSSLAHIHKIGQFEEHERKELRAAYEALQKENAELKERVKTLLGVIAKRYTDIIELNKKLSATITENESQAKRIAELEKPPKQKMAPVQGYVQGIPWDMHLEAYNAYCKRYGAQQALIEGDCRGGFGVGELDMFIPGWREKLSLVGKLNAEIESLRKQVEEIKELCAKEAEHWQKIGKNPDHACGQYIAAAIRGIKPASKNGE